MFVTFMFTVLDLVFPEKLNTLALETNVLYTVVTCIFFGFTVV